MKVWVDPQISPAIARCLQDEFGADAQRTQTICGGGPKRWAEALRHLEAGDALVEIRG